MPRKLLAGCQLAKVPHLLHISALGATGFAPSQYLRSKAAGEAVLRDQHGVTVTILQPSVVFGPGDSFLNLFAQLARILPILPLAGASTRFQPVYVGDVVAVIMKCLLSPGAAGGTHELAGPKVYSLRELVSYVSGLIGKSPKIVALPEALAMLQGAIMGLAPQPLMSCDNVRSLRQDNVIKSGDALPFGITPTTLESIAPGYLAAPDVWSDLRSAVER